MFLQFDLPARAAFVVALTVAATACAANVPAANGVRQSSSASDDEDAAADLLARSRELIRAGRYGQARALLEPELAARPNWAEGHIGLALAYVKEERWETARKLLERGLELDAGLHRARLPHGWCLYYLGRLEAARKSVEAFLAVEPDYPDAVFALALIELDGEDLTRAEGLLRRVVMLSRANRDAERQALAHARLADVYLRRDKPSRARLELDRSLELAPDDPRVHFKMSRVLQLLGDTEGAEASRRQYLRLQQASP